MGLSTKKQTSNTTENQQTANTATTTPNVPSWLLNPSQQIAGNIGGLLNQGSQAFAPTTSGLQQRAFDAAGGLKNSSYLDDSAAALGNVGDVSADPWSAAQAESSSLLDGGLDKYYNPFKDQVLNPVLNDYDTQSGITRAGQAASAARNKAFQGSRFGIQEGQTEGELARGRAATEGGLLDNMYTQATGLAQSDADRRQQVALANAAATNQASATNQSAALQASQGNQQAALERARQMAALGLSEGSETRANLGLQAGLGGVLTDQENAAAQYPIQFQQQMAGLLQGLNPSNFIGRTIDSTGTMSGTTNNTSTQTQSGMDSLGQAAQIAALFLPSDKRLKVDIETFGYDGRGRRWVTFAYVWEPLKRLMGVIAQEVRRTDPQAVVRGADGYLRVNYGALC